MAAWTFHAFSRVKLARPSSCSTRWPNPTGFRWGLHRHRVRNAPDQRRFSGLAFVLCSLDASRGSDLVCHGRVCNSGALGNAEFADLSERPTAVLPIIPTVQ